MRDVILITGASSAVGRELLTSLGDRDATIYAHYAGKGEALRSHVASISGKADVLPIQADFRSAGEVDALVETVRRKHGHANKFVHLSARPLALQRFGQLDWGDLQADFDVSVRSITTILRAFLPALAREGVGGSVVFMLSSITIGEPPKGMAAYTVVKYSLLGLMRSLAAEFSSSGIRLNAVSPYTMETPFLAGVPHKFAELTAAQNPTGRNATPRDVVPAIQFLLSEEARFIQGVNLAVTAGAAY
jgi:3-oxoacyl-[acyl-carrier protein] reductase